MSKSNQFMDRSLYTAAVEGKVDDLLRVKDVLKDAVTPNKNTVLHITALFGHAESVNVIVKSCSSLLDMKNFKGDTALHMASREGHSEVVRALIECGKALDKAGGFGFGSRMSTEKMLRLTNHGGDMALHKAVQYGHVDIVKLLVEEDPEFSHRSNQAGKTPLYLAAEKGFEDYVKVILNTCTSPPYSGPGGRTALHAAVISNSEGSTMELLSWKPCLADEADQDGWSPLHWAANFGQVEIVRTIISENPICAEMVNGQGQNVLHVAVEKKQQEVIKFILQSPWTRSLINQEDYGGRSPLHLLAASDYFVSDNFIINVFSKNNWTPMDIVYSLVDQKGNTQSSHISEERKRVGAVSCLTCGVKEVKNDQNSSNNQATNLVSQDNSKNPTTNVVSQDTAGQDRKREREMERPRRQVDVRMVVAALIVTVTFTAGFTIPGGFNGNDGPAQGMAALITRLAIFRAFVISDALSLILSSIALVIYFMEMGNFDQNELQVFGVTADTIAILAMMVAFMTGTYAVLVHSLGLAITTNVLCSFFFIFFFSLFYYRDRSRC